eukprot:TRINITY_DN10178_c0_g1_i2.p1 TRINITY_DN10178_c0_g1~~TRINITY_DN10178_c0_g1_i2.p1  ORF type:complete len:158 (+),score=25.16 TRINITY_DN10178_c0_g1_i2:65-538(+)
MCIRDRVSTQSTWGKHFLNFPKGIEMSSSQASLDSKWKLQLQIEGSKIELSGNVDSLLPEYLIKLGHEASKVLLDAILQLPKFNFKDLRKILQVEKSQDELYGLYSSQVDQTYDGILKNFKKTVERERLKSKRELLSMLDARKGVIDYLHYLSLIHI